jgi:hypothetical protein
MNARKSLAVSALIATTVALSGCSGVFVEVVDPNGLGVCDGEAVSIDVTQNAGGDRVTIVYTGPVDVSLVAYQGAYSDSRFFGLLPTESFLFGYPFLQETTEGGPDVAINRLGAVSDNWDVTGSEDLMVVTYDGPVSEFLDELTYSEGDFGSNIAADAILPVTVGVMCDESFGSTVFAEVVSVSEGVMEGFSVAAAQAFYPNFMYASVPTVTDQTVLANGISGKMTLPAEIGDSLPDDFTLTEVNGTAVYLGAEDPMQPPTDETPYTLANAELGDIWLYMTVGGLELGAEGLTLEFTGDPSLTEPVDFTLTTDSETDVPEEGYYLLTLFVAETEGDGDSGTLNHLRIVTSVMNIDGDGLTFESVEDREGLAPTGGDPNVIIWAVLGGLVVLAAVALRPKRRKAQAESTIDPSARKE